MLDTNFLEFENSLPKECWEELLPDTTKERDLELKERLLPSSQRTLKWLLSLDDLETVKEHWRRYSKPFKKCLSYELVSDSMLPTYPTSVATEFLMTADEELFDTEDDLYDYFHH